MVFALFTQSRNGHNKRQRRIPTPIGQQDFYFPNGQCKKSSIKTPF